MSLDEAIEYMQNNGQLMLLDSQLSNIGLDNIQIADMLEELKQLKITTLNKNNLK